MDDKTLYNRLLGVLSGLLAAIYRKKGKLKMKRFTLALSMFAVLSLAACTNGGTWTPMSDGRTAGEGTVTKTAPAKASKADKTFSKAMHK